MATAGGAKKQQKAPASKKAATAKRPRKKKTAAAATAKHDAVPTAVVSSSAAAAGTSSSAVQVPDRGPLATLVLDSGGWTVKHGTVLPSNPSASAASATSGPPQPRLSPNATARPHHQLTVLCGDQITQISNQGQLTFTRPLERGYPTDLTAQLRVWRRVCDLEGILAQPQAVGVGGGDDLRAVLAGTTLGGGGGGGKKRGAAGSRAATPALDAPVSTLSSAACQVLLLSQPFTPRSIADRVGEVLFRDLGFVRVGTVLGQCASAFRYVDNDDLEARMELRLVNNSGSSDSSGGGDEDPTDTADATEKIPFTDDETRCCLVVDSGFSLTHVVPTYQCRAVSAAICRVNIGGRTITNLLKEWVSYRQWNMMDESALVNEAKEALCYVSPSPGTYDAEMAAARQVRLGYRTYDREFVLPDFADTFTGSIRLAAGLRKRVDQEEREKERRERKELKKRQRQKEMEKGKEEDKEGGKKSKGDGKKKKKGGGGRKRKMGADKANTEEDADDENNDNDGDDDDAEVDSDDETDEQRLRRIQRMKEEERRRRELEEESRQALTLSVERFAAPEILFRPDDVGLDQGGIAETIVQSVEACPDYLRAAMYHNVLLTGGNARIPGFARRLERELRSLAPAQYAVRVCVPEDPVTYAWKGAQRISQQVSNVSNAPEASDSTVDVFRKCFVDRVQWEAGGSSGGDAEDEMIVM